LIDLCSPNTQNFFLFVLRVVLVLTILVLLRKGLFSRPERDPLTTLPLNLQVLRNLAVGQGGESPGILPREDGGVAVVDAFANVGIPGIARGGTCQMLLYGDDLFIG